MEHLKLNINLSFQQLVDVIKQLSPDEKLKLNEVIWSEDMDIPIKHQKLVMARIERARQNPKRMLNWNKAAKKLRP